MVFETVDALPLVLVATGIFESEAIFVAVVFLVIKVAFSEAFLLALLFEQLQASFRLCRFSVKQFALHTADVIWQGSACIHTSGRTCAQQIAQHPCDTGRG
ncbi:MAG: hypothetical protein LLF96_08100 [Eubacteriales bacterium]|nr:hypothetical protein [Eubacteriales bacterium]